MHKYTALFFNLFGFSGKLEWCMLLSVTTFADDFKIAIATCVVCTLLQLSFARRMLAVGFFLLFFNLTVAQQQ